MIPDKITDPNRGTRIVFVVFGLIIMLVEILFWIMPDLSAFECVIATIAFVLVGLAVIAMGALGFPYVFLDHDGVTVRFLRKKTFTWDQISQTGRYHRDRRTPEAHRYVLVLLLPGGSPKHPGDDKGFLTRNLFKSIALPNDRNTRLFICQQKGSLDFDDYDQLSDSKKKAYQLDKT